MGQNVLNGAKFYRESVPMPCVRAYFPEGILPDLLRLFSPFFFTISGESSRQVTQMEKRKSGRGPPKSDAALSQDIHRILNSFALLLLLRSYNDRSRPDVAPRRTRRPSSPTCVRGRAFLQRSRERLSPFSVSLFSFYPRIESRWESTTRGAAPNG